MQVSVQNGGRLAIYVTTDERRKFWPTSPRVRFVREERQFWLEGTSSSAAKNTEVRNLLNVHQSEKFQVIVPPEIHRYQFLGLHGAVPTEVKCDEKERVLVAVPLSFFKPGKEALNVRRKTPSRGTTLAASELTEAELAIKLLNNLVDRGRVELVLREGHIRAVARITLGG